MSKIYLQEKITPVAGKYIIVGSDGNLTTGDLPQSTLPTISINVPSGTNTITCVKGTLSLNVNQLTDTTYSCNPTEFGIWTISGNYNGDILSDTLNVTEITNYFVYLSETNS